MGDLSFHECRFLFAAVVWRAALDARSGDAGALAWLHSPEAAWLADPAEFPAWPPDVAGVSQR